MKALCRHPQLGMPILKSPILVLFRVGNQMFFINTPYPIILLPYPFDFPLTLEYLIPKDLTPCRTDPEVSVYIKQRRIIWTKRNWQMLFAS